MTQIFLNHQDRAFDGEMANQVGRTGPNNTVDEVGDLLEKVRAHTLKFLSDIPNRPQFLRIRAGEVSVEVEWADESPVIASGSTEGVNGTAPEITESAAGIASALHYLKAPTVGVFYRAPAPNAKPFVTKGDNVVIGQQVGIVEVMKLMIPIEAGIAGRIVEVLKEDGTPVEYDEKLFSVVSTDEA